MDFSASFTIVGDKTDPINPINATTIIGSNVEASVELLSETNEIKPLLLILKVFAT
ncbi:MAG: hypothetical protein FWF10_11665 [Clostridiales bacterium]|nr:hypothetical protein [Clostridiales bacterium]